MALVGRVVEENAIASLVSGARGGRSGLLALVGDPGIGKSALLDFGVGLAGGMKVLRARGVQSEAQIPFAGLSELLRPALHCLSHIPAHQAAALGGALALTPARAEDRFAVGVATLSLLATYAEDRPALIVVDDAQWLDGSSADALSFAFRRLFADPVAVLLGARAGTPSLIDKTDIPQLRLGGLDFDASATLLRSLAGPVPEDLVLRLHRQTGGNPLALIEAAGEAERLRDGVPLDVPLAFESKVSEVYAARIRTLPERSRAILAVAAASDVSELVVLGRAARRLGLDLTDLVAAEANGLLELLGGRVEFRHPLVRSAAYSGASPEERRRAHRALAETLPDAEADRRAWHLALSATGPDEAACSALEQAAARGKGRNAYEVAARAFERAAQLAPEEDRRARLLYEAASAAWQAGDGKKTRELLERATSHAAGPKVALAIAHLQGHVASRLGPVSDGLSALLAAARQGGGDDPEQAAVMLSEAVNAAFYAGDADVMRLVAAEIEVIEPRLRAGRTKFFATMAKGMALVFSDCTGKGVTLLRQAVELAMGAPHEGDDPHWLTWAAMGPIWLREEGVGRALVVRANEVARSRAAIGLLPYLLSHVAIDQATTNRWAEAEATFYEVLELSKEAGQLTDRSAALARLACLEARQGKEGPCLDHAREAIGLADELGLRLCKIWALAAMGELYLAQGRTVEALANFGEQQALLEAARIGDVDLSPAPELVELHLRCGNPVAAASLATEYHRKALEKGQPWALARALRALALLASEGEAEALFSEALADHAKTPDAFEAARTHLSYGSRLRRARQRLRAREELNVALQTMDALGAVPWSTIARNEIAATGLTARQRTGSTRYQLTPQELQIAHLLASQSTTKQAAAALFLSPKTVEYHLRNIYRKLGCNTREELAAFLDGDRGPATPKPVA